MKKFLLSLALTCSVFSLEAQEAAGTASFSEHARFLTAFSDGGAYPASLDYTLKKSGFGKGSTTFGGGKQGKDGNPDFTWGQIVQFDVPPEQFEAFNAGREFTLTIRNGFKNSQAQISVYASVVQLKEIPGNQGSTVGSIMKDVSGSGAVNRWFANQTPHKPGGPMVSLGSFTPTENGEWAIQGNRALNDLLSGTTFHAERAAIYLVFVNTSRIHWAPPGISSGEPPQVSVFKGSTIRVMPLLP